MAYIDGQTLDERMKLGQKLSDHDIGALLKSSRRRPTWFGDEFDPTTAKAIGGRATARVQCGSYPANPLGLFDMHGNVHELCWDAGRIYTHDAAVDPAGELDESETNVVRVGAGTAQTIRLRSSHRNVNDHRCYPNAYFAHISKGFRVLQEVESL